LFLYGFFGSVLLCFVVRFNIVCGVVLHDLWGLRMLTGGFAGNEISEEEGDYSLLPSSTTVSQLKAVWTSSYECFR
jgi:hypothetical protein